MSISKILISLAAVPLSLVRPYMRGWDRHRYADIFKKYGAGNGKEKYRIYIPLGKDQPVRDAVVPESIIEFLKSKKMTLDSWTLGTAIMPDGKRTVRLGKVLPPDLLKIFESDESRKAARILEGHPLVVISRHPYDIVGMSFQRGWTSCMNLENGEASETFVSDVKHGTLVAYLVSGTDLNINKPLARIAIRPYVAVSKGNHLVKLVPGLAYGSSTSAFVSTVNTFCRWANSGTPNGEYALAKGLYLDFDTSPARMYHYSGGELPSNVKALRKIAEDSTVDPSVLTTLSSHADKQVRSAALRNPSTPESVLLESDLKSKEVVMALLLNPNCPVALQKRMLKLEGPIRHTLAAVCVSPELLEVLARDKDQRIREAVASNPKASTKAKLLLLEDSADISMRVIGNFTLQKKVVDTILTDDLLSASAASAPRINVNLAEALAEKAPTKIKVALASNVNSPRSALMLMFTSADVEVRKALANNRSLDKRLLISGLTAERSLNTPSTSVIAIYEAKLAAFKK